MNKAVTIKGDRYRVMLNEVLFTKNEEEDIGNSWFQQKRATCHTAEATLNVLCPVFEDRVTRAWSFRGLVGNVLTYEM